MAEACAGCLLCMALNRKTYCTMHKDMCIFAEQTVPVPMRHFLILTSLGMLLLSSCEPEGGSSEVGINKRDRKGKWQDTFVDDKMSPAQIAAQNSVGNAPQSRNLIAAVEDTCPVHHEKMKQREIPVVFEEIKANGDESATAEFPFGAEKIVSAGNALLPGEPLTARVYQCASCIAARRLAEVRGRQSDPPTRPE